MMAGIMRMRSQVRAMGRFQRLRASLPGVEMLIDHLGQLAPQSPYLCKVVDARTQDSLQSSELAQQRSALDWPQPRNALEYRLAVALGSLASVTGDSEAMRLIAHALDEMQRAGVRWQDERRIAVRQEELLLAGPSIGALGDPDERDARYTELLEHARGLCELALPPIDQQHIGRIDLTVPHPLVAPGERLMHGRVVIARLDSRDVEAPVLPLEGALGSEHDAGGDRIGASRVADVEALEALRRERQTERIAQLLEMRLDLGALESVHLEGLLGVPLHHLEPARADPAHRARYLHPMAGALRECRLQEGASLEVVLHDDLGRRLALEVVLRDERRQDLGQLGERSAREEGRTAETAPAPHEHERHAELPVGHGDRDDVRIMIEIGGDDLLRLDHLEVCELVAHPRRFLEVQPLGGLLHATRKLLLHLIIASLEHLDRRVHIAGILLLGDQPDARGGAALDLILQTGARAMRKVSILAVAQPKELLQLLQALACRPRGRVRTEEAARLFA